MNHRRPQSLHTKFMREFGVQALQAAMIHVCMELGVSGTTQFHIRVNYRHRLSLLTKFMHEFGMRAAGR